MSDQKKEEILIDVLGSPHRSGGELLFYCPKCKHHKAKLSCNVRKNVFKCWVCNFTGTNLARLIKRYGSYKQKQEWSRYDDKVDLSSTTLADTLFGEQEASETLLNLPKEFITLTGKHNSLSNIPLRYLYERGVNKEDILKWKIGYCPDGEYTGRIIVPSFNLEGKINYFIGRSYRDDWMKYKNPPLHKNIIFNHLYLDEDKPLFLVEGVFDAIKCENGLPILGSTISENSALFKYLVEFPNDIYVALDADARKKQYKIIETLLQYDVQTYAINVPPRTDIGEMSKEQVKELASKANFISNSDTFFIYRTMY